MKVPLQQFSILGLLEASANVESLFNSGWKMKRSKVIVYSKIPKEIQTFIKETHELVYFEKLDSNVYDQFLSDLKDAEGIMGSGLKVDTKLLNQAPMLKIVSNISVGYNNLDIKQLTNRNIIATNTPDVLTETTADTIFGLLLATARRIPELDQLVKSKQWDQTIGEDLFGIDVHNKVLGIIGMGRIGSAIVKRANKGFDMKILYHNRTRNEDAENEYNAKYCSIDELLKKSDFVCLMTPLTNETRNLIGKREFSLMKKSAIFINGSRGETVNEKDLIEALKEGKIKAAGLDVFEKEPIEKEHPFLQMKNVVTLPHIGSATLETRNKMIVLAANNLVQGLIGDNPTNVINKEVLQKK